MKRVLIFSLAYYPSNVSGAEAAIKEITERIDPIDIEFHMITLHFDTSALREEKIGNVFVHRIGFGGGYLSKMCFIPLAAITARKLNHELHFNALWSVMTYMLFPVVLARMIGVHVRHILTLQDGDSYEKVFQRWFIRPVSPLLDYGFRKASIIQVISSYLGTWPARRGSKSPVVLIHNAANPRDLHDNVSQEEITELQEKLGKKPGEIYLVNTARLEYQKGNDDVIRALSSLPENIKFLSVGAGSEETMLKDLVTELHLEEHVIFTGNVDRSVVTVYRRASDIFVCPSRSEGLGNAFLSAMASRLPVIATQEGGLADFVFDKTHNPEKEATAWVVDKNNPEQIAEAVKDILAHPEKTKQITDTARAMVLEKFDWDNIAKEMREKIFGFVLR